MKEIFSIIGQKNDWIKNVVKIFDFFCTIPIRFAGLPSSQTIRRSPIGIDWEPPLLTSPPNGEGFTATKDSGRETENLASFC